MGGAINPHQGYSQRQITIGSGSDARTYNGMDIGDAVIADEQAQQAGKYQQLHEVGGGSIESKMVQAQINRRDPHVANRATSNGYADVENYPGLLEKGNIDLTNRPVVRNADGSISTEQSGSYQIDGREVLLPHVVNGKVVDSQGAIAHFLKTGEHLGKFAPGDITNINSYSEKLHSRKMYINGKEHK